MSKDALYAWTTAAWVVACALTWAYAAKGYSEYPRFDRWLFGIVFWVNLVTLGVSVSALVRK